MAAANLHLVLTGRWFDEVDAGLKTVEYRRDCPFWRRRIWERRKELQSVTFTRGYTRRRCRRRVVAVDRGPCPYPGWPGRYIRLHLELSQ